MPPPTEALLTVSSSADALSPEFSGIWRGYLVRPKTDAHSGMVSEAVILRVSSLAPEVQGDLVLKGKSETKTYNLYKSSGKKSHLAGKLKQVRAVSSVLDFQIDIAPEEESWMLKGTIPKLSGTLILRRDPKP